MVQVPSVGSSCRDEGGGLSRRRHHRRAPGRDGKVRSRPGRRKVRRGWCWMLCLGVATGTVLSGCAAPSGVTQTFTPTVAAVHSPGTGSADTGESGSGEPSTAPSASATVSDEAYEPATSTSPAKNVPVPRYPEAAKAKTKAGQKAFIKYWFQVFNYTVKTGDSSVMIKYSSASCEFCVYTAKGAKKMLQEDGVWPVGEGAAIQINSAVRHPKVEGSYPWDVPTTDAAAMFYTGRGSSSKYKPRGARIGVVRIWVQWRGGHWITRDSRKVVTRGGE